MSFRVSTIMVLFVLTGEVFVLNKVYIMAVALRKTSYDFGLCPSYIALCSPIVWRYSNRLKGVLN
jgi:hypothetical protein